MVKNTRPHRDLLRELGTRLPRRRPATAGTHYTPQQRSQNTLAALTCAQIVLGVVFGVRAGLRHPRQLTVHAIASETFTTVSDVLRAARAVTSAAGREDHFGRFDHCGDLILFGEAEIAGRFHLVPAVG